MYKEPGFRLSRQAGSLSLRGSLIITHVVAMEPTEKPLYPKRRRIYLMRHGDVSYFDPSGRPFRPDTVPLNDEGRLQAEAAGRLLADIPPAEIESTFIGAFVADVTRESRFLAGETFGSLIDRVQICFQNLLADRIWKHLLIVAHGGVNRIILAHALGIGLQGFGAIEQEPGCLNILDVDDAGRMLI